MTERKLLLERLDRLADTLDDEALSKCAELVRDAIDMLKEQEAQSVIVREKQKNGNILWFADCPKCKHGIERDKHKHFCGFCGQAVKWD